MEVREIIPFPVWIIPFPVLKIDFEPLGSYENDVEKEVFKWAPLLYELLCVRDVT